MLMEELQAINTPREFHSLTAIMERFQTVPYEQFQQELQNWFEQNLAKQQDLNGRQEPQEFPDFLKLQELISKIYHQAEVSQTMADARITQADEPK
jgi:hypothetical protein